MSCFDATAAPRFKDAWPPTPSTRSPPGRRRRRSRSFASRVRARARALEAADRTRPAAAPGDVRAPARSAIRRGDRRGAGAVFPGPGERDRRGRGRAAAAWRPRGDRGGVRGAGADGGLRLAEPGEFTRRAFENGKLDLTTVEGLADLIYADTEAQRRQALRQLQGLLGDRAEAWRRQADRGAGARRGGHRFLRRGRCCQPMLQRRRCGLPPGCWPRSTRPWRDAQRGERLREGLVVAIAGPPNAGKSTLLNRIARREAAIVSPFAGTTRDVIEVHLDLGGYPVTLLDTAGIRETDDPVEREGVARARKRAGEADLVLWVVEAGAVTERFLPSPRARSAWRGGWPASRSVGGVQRPGSCSTRAIFSELHRAHRRSAGRGRSEADQFAARFDISATTGEGVRALVEALTAFAAETFGSREPALVTRERQRKALEQAADALKRAVSETPRGYSGRGTAACGAGAGPAHRPGRCRGHPGRDFPRFLHRQVNCGGG